MQHLQSRQAGRVWLGIAVAWGIALLALLLIGAVDQWAKWTEPEDVYSNAVVVSTPVGNANIKTGGILYFPGRPIDLEVRVPAAADEVATLDSVRYSIKPVDSGAPAAEGMARLIWARTESGMEARIPNLFPIPPESHSLGQAFAIGEYDVVVEFRSGLRTAATSPPLKVRIEKQRH